MPLNEFGGLILLTNFFAYVQKFSTMFTAPIRGIGGPMQACTSASGIRGEGTGLDYFSWCPTCPCGSAGRR